MKGANLFFFLFLTITISAQESKLDWLQLRGYVKNMQTFQASDLDYISINNLVHNRLNFRLFLSENITVGLEVRNRVFNGDLVQFNDDFAQTVDLDEGLIDLGWVWLNQKSMVGLSQVDRAWVKYTSDKWEMTVGRQRINWGLNAFWNSNDLFNTFNLADFDYEERPGSDAIRVQRYFKGNQSFELAVAPSTDGDRWVGAGMYKFNKWTYDIQLLGAWWNEDYAAGLGWAGNIKTAGFKGEATYFHPRQNWQTGQGVLSASLSLDYIFKGNWYLMGGFLYASNGEADLLNVNQLNTSGLSSTAPPSAKRLMPTRYNAMMSLNKAITPLVNMSMVGLYAFRSNLLFVMPSASISVASNWDLSLFGQATFLEDASAFKGFGGALFVRLKYGF